MRLRGQVSRFVTPKRGLEERFCEDRAAFEESAGGWRLAISDGATQSVLSGVWAERLVGRFLEVPTQALDQAWLEPARAGYLAEIRAQLPQMSWHQLEKWKRHGGADATLIGVEVAEAVGAEAVGAEAVGAAGEVRWVVAGDSLLVEVAGGEIRIYPEGVTPESLAQRPYLISTRSEANGALWPRVQAGRFLIPAEGLALLLVTDAVAAWLLRDREGAVARLRAVADQAGFEALIGEARDREGMKDDDCTLLRLEIGWAAEARIVEARIAEALACGEDGAALGSALADGAPPAPEGGLTGPDGAPPLSGEPGGL